jgi:signal transduction histidine kinase/ActR/RegA family two-component response regulator
MLLPLAYFTWKFAANLEDFKLSLSAKRLARELNESLTREKKELERQVEIATTDLIHAKEEAEQANKAKTDFLARMSHEIRTPLSAIIGYSDIALDDSTGDELRTSSMQTVSQNSKHLLNLINDVLDVSQIDSGDIKYEQIPCSISDIVTEVVEMMNLKAQRKNLSMDLIISDQIPSLVVTDPTRVKQLVTNLVGNAIKFTEVGEITIEVDARKLSIGEPSSTPDDCSLYELDIAVEDTGVGIEESKLSSIFESFTQESASTKRLYGGTGLGLTISRQIARDLGGDLTVESTPRVGSRFTCTLHAESAGETEVKESLIRSEPINPAQKFANLRFLLIEDGEDNRTLIQYHFEKKGLKLDTASDGIYGIETVNNAKEQGDDYDMIFMDISMPRMDGIECTSKLRSAGITTPIVMLSAHTLQEERERSYIAGATAYMSKPIDFKKLFELCSSIFDEDQISRHPAA